MEYTFYIVSKGHPMYIKEGWDLKSLAEEKVKALHEEGLNSAGEQRGMEYKVLKGTYIKQHYMVDVIEVGATMSILKRLDYDRVIARAKRNALYDWVTKCSGKEAADDQFRLIGEEAADYVYDREKLIV